MRYQVRALDASQQVQWLALDALDEADALQQAADRGFTALAVRTPRRHFGAGRPGFDLLLFSQELLALLDAGLGVVEAVETLIDTNAQQHRRAVLGRLLADLREGLRLSAAMRRQPQVFPPLFAGLVASAEGTSDLPQALGRFIAYESRLHAVRHKLASAAVYPAILLLVGGAVAVFLLGYVVPRFAEVIAGAGRELPWASRMLMAWGRFAADNAQALGAGVLAALAAAVLLLRRRMAGGGWWRLLRLLPGAGRHVQAMELSRLCLTLGMLLEGGIPVVTALELCVAATPAGSRPRLLAVRADVQAGHPLSASLERHGLSSPVAQRLLRVGEHAGQLGAMLTRTAAFHDEETARWIERFTRAFEPALMAVIGLVIGLIVVLLYMPVFELAGSLQ